MPRAPNRTAALLIAGLAILIAPDTGHAGAPRRAPGATPAPRVFSDELVAMARRADFNADGRLDQEDVRRLLAARATGCAQTMTDINGDSAFDQKDLVDMLSLIAADIRPTTNDASLANASPVAAGPARLMALVDRN